MFSKITHIISVAAVLFTAAMLSPLMSCSSDDGPKGPDIGVRDSLPWLASKGVSTLISDSGIIRYKIISEDWFMYDKKDPTFWAFEKGLFIEKFDASFHTDAFITCDTAYFFDQKNLWELRGRVFVKNMKGTTFRTTLLYWDQSKHEIYSPAYMEIDGKDEALSGYDFRSNEEMTEYIIHQSKGRFPFEEKEETPQYDPSVAEQLNDTTNTSQENNQ